MNKKILLLFTGIVFTFSVSAQQSYWESYYPWKASGYTAWSTVADSFQVYMSTDSAWIGLGLFGLTNSAELAVGDGKDWFVSSGTRYSLALSGEQLNVTFNPSKDKESSFNINFFNWVEGPAPETTASSFKGSKMGGYFVDMQPIIDGIDNGRIQGEVKIPASLNALYADNKFPIRISVLDAHGHEWNAGGNPIDTIAANQYDVWTEFDYYSFLEGYGNIEENPGDGLSTKFHGINRPIAGDNTARVPIDFTKIAGLRFYLCPSVNHSDASLDGVVVRFRNITVGQTEGSSVFELSDHKPYCSCPFVVEVFDDPSVVSVELINLLGQTVATVKSMEGVPKVGIAILKVTKEDGSVEIVKIAK